MVKPYRIETNAGKRMLEYLADFDISTVARPRVAAAPIIAAIEAEARDGGLDAAWAEAEAALPTHWSGPHLSRNGNVCRAGAQAPDTGTALGFILMQTPVFAEASTPAAALLALAVRLRGEPQ